MQINMGGRRGETVLKLAIKINKLQKGKIKQKAKRVFNNVIVILFFCKHRG